MQATPDRWWNLVGWTFLIGGFIGLECSQPYYFTQDDALVGELPGILLGCRSLWEGTFPDWNPSHFLDGSAFSVPSILSVPKKSCSYSIFADQ